MPQIAKIIIVGLLLLAYGAPVIPAEASLNSPRGDKEERARNYFGDDVLIDGNGIHHRFFSDLLRNRVVLINVVFTRCQDACPMQTQRLQMVRHQLGERFGRDIVFLTISVDPARDDAAAMKNFAAKQDADVPGWQFVTAETAVISQVLARLGLWTNDPKNHNTLLIAGNASNAHWLKLRPDSPPERIAADLLRLADGN